MEAANFSILPNRKGRALYGTRPSRLHRLVGPTLPQQHGADSKDSAAGKEQDNLSSLYDSREETVHKNLLSNSRSNGSYSQLATGCSQN
jgi:hypothetical protein